MEMKATIIELEEGWELILGGLSKLKRIFDGSSESFNPKDYMLLYQTIYGMCTQKPPNDYAQQLYERCKRLLKDDISQTVLPSLRDIHDDRSLLSQLVRRWANHKHMVRWLSFVFSYIDRFFVARRELKTIKEVGMCCFEKLVFQEMKEKATGAVLRLIDLEREGERIDRSTLKCVLDMFDEVREMHYYEGDFEKDMLQHTADYYRCKASNWILEDVCRPDYLLMAEGCLRREKERVTHYLRSSSEKKLLDVVWNQLLSPDETWLLEKEHLGWLALLKNDKVDDLSIMHRLFSMVKWRRERYIASQFFKQHVIDVGMALVKEAEDSASTHQFVEKRDLHEHIFVWKIIELNDKYLPYVSKNGCFNNDPLFHKALHESFDVFCNKSVFGSSAELLSNFCDKILKKGGVGELRHEAIEPTLEKVIKLIAYISDKDLFLEFYRKKVGRRLLHDTSASDDHERSFISKLKQHFGGQFTSKMEVMIKDMALAKEKQVCFQQYMDANISKASTPEIDLSVTVLTAGFWPSYKSHDVNLPQEMAQCVKVFKEFYQTDTKHRRLSWIYSMGTCNIIGKFKWGPIELVVTTYQACLLMLFNSCDRLSCSEIAAQLNLPEDDVVRLLRSLSCTKYKILIKTPDTKTVSPSDVFEFNSMFTGKMRRIKIPLPPLEEKKKVMKDVNNDRRYSIDATIIRIMKCRKVLDYEQLVSACLEQISPMFKPDNKVIKLRIEDLISRDYLARDHGNPNLFKYLA